MSRGDPRRERFELIDHARKTLATMVAAERCLELEARLSKARDQGDPLAAGLRLAIARNQIELRERITLLRTQLQGEIDRAVKMSALDLAAR